MSTFFRNRSASRSALSRRVPSACKRLSCTTPHSVAGSAIENEDVGGDDPVERDTRKHVGYRRETSSWSKVVYSEIPDRVQQPAESEPLRRAFPTHQTQRSESNHLE